MRYYHPSYGVVDGRDEFPDDAFKVYDDLVEEKKDGTFHIGQFYDKIAVTLFCKVCGGKAFNVGTSDHWTGIKCVQCGWEICIHEG